MTTEDGQAIINDNLLDRIHRVQQSKVSQDPTILLNNDTIEIVNDKTGWFDYVLYFGIAVLPLYFIIYHPSTRTYVLGFIFAIYTVFLLFDDLQADNNAVIDLKNRQLKISRNKNLLTLVGGRLNAQINFADIIKVYHKNKPFGRGIVGRRILVTTKSNSKYIVTDFRDFQNGEKFCSVISDLIKT